MALIVDRREGAASFAAVSILAACACAFLIVAACERPAPGPGDDGDAGGDLPGDDAGLDSPDAAAADAAGEPDAGAADASDLSDAGADASCDPPTCDGKCGPIFDPCSQKTIQCGACKEATKVCDIEKHECIEPKSTCAALGAQCGAVKTSCGIHIACPDCPVNQWCDPKTHQCTTCTPVTCQDLGYECGDAWNGCGPRTNNLSCGPCADSNKVCNTALHICEPKCTPPPDATVCAAAKANGVECGYITNGCGGLANCGGCPTGQKCGSRGIANRCEPEETSVECLVLGQNCGTIQSACGGTVSCGACTGTDQCNANGVCGPKCVPKTCASAEYQGKCGVGLDDGCGGKLRCDCGGGKACSTLVSGEAGTCGDFKSCTDYGATGAAGAPCSNSASDRFPKGDGTNLMCKCSGTAVCIAASDAGSGGTVVQGNASGTCCQNTAQCGDSCNTHVIDTCTGAQIDCSCKSGSHCEGTTCVADKTCAAYGASGAVGNPCSNAASAAFPKGDNTNLTCKCTVSGAVCISGTEPNGTVVSGGTAGHCCKNSIACAAHSCNVTLHDSCTNAAITCNTCTQTEHCEGTTCVGNKTCSTYGANGAVGNPCSIGDAFDRGDGQLFDCPCSSGVCSKDGHLVTGNEKGTCCLNSNAACDGVHCNDALHPYSVVDSCTGQVTTCGCNSARYCKDGTCQLLETCASYTDRGLGHPCSNQADPDFPRGDGTNLRCPCTDSGAVCISGPDGSGTIVSGGATGHCCRNTNSCAPGSCNTSYVDTCTGATVQCNTCTGTQHCDMASHQCVENNTCATFTDQKLGHPCSNGADPDFPKGDGTDLICMCTDSGAVCISGTEPNGTVVSGSTTGHCCKNTNACPAGSCNTSVHNSCTNATINCNTCTAQQHCEGTTCVANKTCSTYGASGATGNPCSVNPAFDRGDGQLFKCDCTTPGVCSSGGHAVTGTDKGTCCTNTVACAADACSTSVVNQCTGATITCPNTCSDPNKHCDTAQKKCVDNATCATYSANGKIGDKCSTVSSSAFPKGNGTNLTCACSQNGGPSGEATPNIQCTGSNATTAGTCTCVPTSCAILGSGIHLNDGCGKQVNCNS